MNSVKYIPLLFLLSGCSTEESKGRVIKQEQNSAVIDNIAAEAPAKLNVNYNFRPKEEEKLYRGTFVSGAEWSDRRGNNRIIISTTDDDYNWRKEMPWMQKIMDADPDNVDLVNIFAYHYVFDKELQKWKAYWTLHDYRTSCCDVYVNYQQGSLLVEDIDSDGKAESSFAYYFPLFDDLYYPAKLILHADSAKLKAEGTIGLDKVAYEDSTQPARYEGNLLRDSLYLNWTKRRWTDCKSRQDSLDRLRRKKIRAAYKQETQKQRNKTKDQPALYRFMNCAGVLPVCFRKTRIKYDGSS